ncbi:asialoglycoprotein receptor 1-like [Solea solea]|uniref:asialoglycoprotein receptor 1-like n=1 Tax=Solea solea TaxID=90069 RepID=UPI00272B57E0|nr:asialoglycoprotein receptor 1-like [Solea solea]
MVGHQRFPWINNPTRATAAASAKQEHDDVSSRFLRSRKTRTCRRPCPMVGLSALCLLLFVICAALTVLYANRSNRKPDMQRLFRYQNMSDRFLALTKVNVDLKTDNEVLKAQSVQINEQNRLLNRTSADLESMNLALTLESRELAEQVVNLTSTNAQFEEEREQLVVYSYEREEKMANMSQTVDQLLSSNAWLQEENQRVSETSDLLRDELLRVREKNQELEEISEGFQREIQNLTEKIRAFSRDCDEKLTQLQEQKQNLSMMQMKDQQEAAERTRSKMKEVDKMVADILSAKEAYRALDLYCPVVNQKTKERFCKKCHNSWKQFETKCYYFSSRTLDWSSSRAWCRTQGGDLVIINSEQEQRFMFDSGRTLEPSGARLWVGMSDEHHEGQWHWVDGSKVTSDVQFWLSRTGVGAEPDDWNLDDPRGEDCGHIDVSEDTLKSWMDGSCQRTYRWICEKNI